jgi:hypothetical protein
MRLAANIPKQIEYKNVAGLPISQIMQSTAEQKKWRQENKINPFAKWSMPKEPGGFLKYRKNDPL